MDTHSPTCFTIIPFEKAFEEIEQIVKCSAEESKLQYVRGDSKQRPGSVLAQIVDQIRSAALVVADITGNNPNVLYELGIAHQLKGPDRVVIISQDLEQCPYDLKEFRQLQYHHNEEGRNQLCEELPEAMETALSVPPNWESWSVVRGRLQRTQLIVRDLRNLLDHMRMDGGFRPTIRTFSGLTPLAICEGERGDSPNSEEDQYREALLEERNALRDLLSEGATMYALLHPPRWMPWTTRTLRLSQRYERLIDLLRLQDGPDLDEEQKKDLRAIQQSKILFTPIAMPNVLIIDDRVAYEGIKQAGISGFEMTHCETDSDMIASRITRFDDYFAARLNELGSAPHSNEEIAEQLHRFHSEATSDPLSH